MGTLSALVTGGAGFIGCGVADQLVRRGFDVVVADSLHPQVHPVGGRPERLSKDVTLVPLDVTHPASWDAVLRLHRPEVVVHLAAETGTGQSLLEASRHGTVNVVGTTQMLDAFTRSGHLPAHIVLSSSRAVYGEGAWTNDEITWYPGPRTHEDLAAGRWDPPSPDARPGRPVPSVAGTTSVHPSNVYGATKLAQEHICQAWATALGVDVSILRFQNVYGSGQSVTNSYTGVLTLFARLALSGRPIPVFEDGAIMRDFVYVDDVVGALLGAIERPPGGGRVLDIGSGSPSSLGEVATVLARLCGAPPPVVTGEFRDGDVRAAFCSIDDAREALGWTPTWRLEQGLRELTSWVRAACPAAS